MIMKKTMIAIMVVDIGKILGKIMMRGMIEMKEGEMIMMIDFLDLLFFSVDNLYIFVFYSYLYIFDTLDR